MYTYISIARKNIAFEKAKPRKHTIASIKLLYGNKIATKEKDRNHSSEIANPHCRLFVLVTNFPTP